MNKANEMNSMFSNLLSNRTYEIELNGMCFKIRYSISTLQKLRAKCSKIDFDKGVITKAEYVNSEHGNYSFFKLMNDVFNLETGAENKYEAVCTLLLFGINNTKENRPTIDILLDGMVGYEIGEEYFSFIMEMSSPKEIQRATEVLVKCLANHMDLNNKDDKKDNETDIKKK